MKALVFSDNHGSLEELDYVLSKFNFDRVFGLGDFEVSEYELQNRSITGVRGNSYFDPAYPYDLIADIEGFKILFTHGHTHQVKYGLLSLSLFAKEAEVDIAFYGHTHMASIKEDKGIYFINPGSISRPYKPTYPTCAILDFSLNKLDIKIIDVSTFEIYDEISIDKK